MQLSRCVSRVERFVAEQNSVLTARLVVESECARHARRRSESEAHEQGVLGGFRCSLAFAFGGWQRSCSRGEGGERPARVKHEPDTAATPWIQPPVGSALSFPPALDASRLSARNCRAFCLAVLLCTGVLTGAWRLAVVRLPAASWLVRLVVSSSPAAIDWCLVRVQTRACFAIGSVEDAGIEREKRSGNVSRPVWGGCCY